MFDDKILYHIISIFQEQSGLYSVYGQGIDVDTELMGLVRLGSYRNLEEARDNATLKAAESDCYVVETLKGSRQKAIDVNENIEIGGWTK